MKSTKLKIAGLLSLAVFTALLFVSCDFWTIPETREVGQHLAHSALSREDVLALWHLAEKHETPEEELRDKIQMMLRQNVGIAARSTSSITGVRRFSITVENGFSSVTANNRSETTEMESSDIPFYVFYLENHAEQTNGFALASGDPRIGGLLALVEEGDFDDTENPFWQMFLSMLDAYVLTTIQIYNSVRDEDIAAALARRGTQERGTREARFWWHGYNVTRSFGPLLTTRWNQWYPYNHIVNIVAGNTDNLWPTGCVATAMAQIMAFHEWPKRPSARIRMPTSNSLSGAYVYSFDNPFPFYINTPFVYFSYVTYDWRQIKYSDDIWSGSEPIPYVRNLFGKYRMQVGVLMLEIGYRVNMQYRHSGSAPPVYTATTIRNAFASMGYISEPRVNYNFGVIRSSLSNHRPVYISGWDNTGTGHAWVIDGYRIAINSAGNTVNFVHCNPGWGWLHNGWYYDGVFTMFPGGVFCPTGRSVYRGKSPEHFYRFLTIVPNIRPSIPTVNIPAIQGVPAPVVGAMPVRTITATNQYTGTVTWSPNHAVFRPGTQYTATITLNAEAGYTFHGVAANFFTAAGATVRNAANSGVITAIFPMIPPPSRLFGGGSGTPCDPYLIFNEEHLRSIYLYPDRSFELADNIDLSQGLWRARFFVHNWTPIPEFHGTFEGNGFTISGLSTVGICVAKFNDYSHLLGSAHHFGLFTGRNFGTIRNLNVHAKSWLVYESPSNHDLYVGVIAGANFGTIENCNTHCDNASMIYLVSLSVSSHARATRVGGIAGYNAGTIIGSNNYGDIFINTQNPNDANMMNGIFGRNSGTVLNSNNFGHFNWV